MKGLLALSSLMVLVLASSAQAGNTSSNSSSNSSNVIHTRVDTIITEDHRGRRIYERRTVRERVPYGYRSKRQWFRTEDDDD
jgi:hypothetical protein